MAQFLQSHISARKRLVSLCTDTCDYAKPQSTFIFRTRTNGEFGTQLPTSLPAFPAFQKIFSGMRRERDALFICVENKIFLVL